MGQQWFKEIGNYFLLPYWEVRKWVNTIVSATPVLFLFLLCLVYWLIALRLKKNYSISGCHTSSRQKESWRWIFFLPSESLAQRLKRLPGMQETWVWSLGREDPLEKEMAIHSSTLAWRMPWREEPGRLQSMGSQRVGHDWVSSLSLSESLFLGRVGEVTHYQKTVT